MPYRRSRSRRRAARQRRIWLLSALAAGGLTCVLFVASSSLFAPGEASDPQDARENRVAEAADPVPEAVGPALYPYSVVPGGVHSPEGLAVAVTDPVVAKHYAPIDIAHARVVSVTAPRRAYVSYRIGDRVYWTKHTVALHAGEEVLSDGVHEIRARCGNRISETPQTPTASDEPDVAEFDRAIAPVPDGRTAVMLMPFGGPFDIQPDGSSAGDLALSAGGLTLPPVGAVLPPGVDAVDTFGGGPSDGSLKPQNITLGGVPMLEHVGGVDADGPHGGDDATSLFQDGPVFPAADPAPIAPVPEPGSMILVGTGLAGCALRAWQRRRRDRR